MEGMCGRGGLAQGPMSTAVIVVMMKLIPVCMNKNDDAIVEKFEVGGDENLK